MATCSDVLTHQRTDDFSSFMFARFSQMRKDGSFTDFKLSVQGTMFPCHRMVVSTHSPFIEAMLTTDMAEAAKQEAELKDVSLESMNILMEYMYTGNISMPFDQLADLLMTANYLQIDRLRAWCVSQVPIVLKPENALAWFRLGDQLNYAEVKKHCDKIMISNFREVVHHDNFLTLDQSILKDYMRGAVKAEVAHDDVLRAIVRWVDQDATKRMDTLNDLIVEEALLNECTPQGILEVMGSYPTFHQAYKVLTNPALHSKHHLRSKQHDQKLIIVGGDTKNVVNRNCWILEGQAEQMEKVLCTIPSTEVKQDHSVCQTKEGFAVTGGRGSTLCLLYNAMTNAWSVLQSLPEIRACHGSVCVKGVINVIGGINGSNAKYVSINYLDAKKGGWQQGSDMPIQVVFPKLALINEHLYVLDDRNTKKLLQMNIYSGTWKELASLPIRGECKGSGMITLNGKLLVAGGVGMICAWYRPETDTWSLGQQPLRKHHYCAMVQYKGRILLMGGAFEDGTDDVEEMSLEDGSWSLAEWKVPASLKCHHAFVLDVSC